MWVPPGAATRSKYSANICVARNESAGWSGKVASASWGLFFGGLVLAIPAVGDVTVPATLSRSWSRISRVRSFSAAKVRSVLLSIVSRSSRDSVFRYMDDIISDDFLVIGHGSADEAVRAKDIFATVSPLRIDLHDHT